MLYFHILCELGELGGGESFSFQDIYQLQYELNFLEENNWFWKQLNADAK